jgi:type I restriction enzyme S subunit
MTEDNGYPEYKDSGVEWLGNLPVSWEVRKLNSVATLKGGGTPNTSALELWEGDITWVTPKDYTSSVSEFLVTSERTITEQGLATISGLIPKNSVLMTCRAPVGNVAISGKELAMNQGFIASIPSGAIDFRFLYFVLKASTAEMQSHSKGGTFQEISRSRMGAVKIPLPPLETQHQIVKFLDTETAHIDAGIANMESLIALLTEKRSALISEVVTRGIPGEHTEFKDSGVAWLGEIPAGWEIKKIGSLFKNRSEKVSDKDFPALSVTKKGIVPQLSSAAKTDDGDNRKKILKGDFVINSRSDRKGSSGVSPLDGSTSLISTVLIPSGELVSEYMHNLLRSVEFQEEYYRYGRGIVADLWTTRFSDMKSISLPVPRVEEQERIVQYLCEAVKEIDALLEAANSAKALLKEKRQTLISDVVTGKIDVTNSTN